MNRFWVLLAIFNLVGIAVVGFAGGMFLVSPVAAALWGFAGGIIIVIVDSILLIRFANQEQGD